MSRGRFDSQSFRRTITPLVRDLAGATSNGLSAYGELVDILAAERNLPAIEQLEACWNEVAVETPLRLLCGYASAHFTAPATAGAIGMICRAHGCVQTDAPDGLGRWLVGSSTTSFSAAPAEL